LVEREANGHLFKKGKMKEAWAFGAGHLAGGGGGAQRCGVTHIGRQKGKSGRGASGKKGGSDRCVKK